MELTQREIELAPNRGSVRLRIEGLLSQGVSNAIISRRLGTSLLHVENVARVWRQAMRKPDEMFAPRHVEKDEAYARACRAQGGFPYAYELPSGQTVYVYQR